MIMNASLATLSQLQIFIRLGSSRNLGAVALSENMTAAQVKRTMKLFEKDLQKPLLRFHGGKVSMTEEGHRLFERSYQMMKGINNAVCHIYENGDGHKNHLTIGISDACKVLLPVIQRFRERYPDTSIGVVGESFRDGFSGHFPDVSIECSAMPPAEDLYDTNTYEFPAYMVKSDIHCLVNTDSELIEVSQNPPEVPSEKTLRGIRVSTYDMAYQLVVAGAGAAMLPEFMIREELKSGSLCKLGAKPGKVFIHLYATMRKRKTPHVESFFDFMKVAIPFYLREVIYFP
jgi:DNA-binding transcriptional LysR family regulator